MSRKPPHHADQALAYPEPPASPLWHRHTAPLTDTQRQRNRELLNLAQRTPRRTSSTKTRTEAR